MSGGLLFVCAANICRSPLMAVRFRAAEGKDGWSVASRGVDAVDGHVMCRIAAEIVGDADGVVEAAEAHESRLLDPADVDEYALIIAASREERGAIARLQPRARERVFTLREAVELGATRLPLDDAAAGDEDALVRYAALLHRRRGLVPPATPRRFFFRPAPSHPSDVPDVHHAGPRRHRAILRAMIADVDTLHAQLDRFRSAEPAEVP